MLGTNTHTARAAFSWYPMTPELLLLLLLLLVLLNALRSV